MEHFGAIFKLDLTEETIDAIARGEAIASSCLILHGCTYESVHAEIHCKMLVYALLTVNNAGK